MSLFQNAAFYTSAHQLSDLPPPNGVEIAFAGRSNAGKSSALNTLANHNRLAYVSKQPGRTQLINFFCLNPEKGDDKFLVDLPGYGYAKVPENVRKHWQGVLSSYLTERTSLFGLVLVMDSRHPLTPLDRQMLDWFCHSGKPVHVLLTKSDKLSRNEAIQTLLKVRKELNRVWGDNVTVQLFSSSKKLGVEETEKMIGGWLFPQQTDKIQLDTNQSDSLED
ncbi:MAG: ribosome biogenesis GTP-binding protein YihA/YsxC [Methylophilaceae bacterium]|jgi:GTP-binding protein|nr:ribosome biogenesis GTP-binding protein YihA/YsxC [Methylophilaceae bacterium]MDG1454431.1 ribosome biogenesis GTP-binding protein YihA/YsxC [Methylophilaceae bacterium]